MLDLVPIDGSVASDPQVADPQLGPFSSSTFLDSWNRSNRSAVSAVLASGEDIAPLRTRPSEELRAIWAWNRRRAAWNDELGEDVFVPAITFLEVEETTCSAVAWGDAVPFLLPQVDVVVIALDALRRGRWFRPFGGMTIATVRWEDLIERLPRHTLDQGPVPFLDLSTLVPSEALIDFFQQLPAAGATAVKRIAKSAVLDDDLVPTSKPTATS